MGKKELVANGQYTDEFKVEAVRLGESVGGNQAAKRLGSPESSLWNWMKLSRAGKLKTAHGAAVAVKRSVTEMGAENVRLRREPASTKFVCPVDDTLRSGAQRRRARRNETLLELAKLEDRNRQGLTKVDSGVLQGA